MSDLVPDSPALGGEIIFFQTEDGRTRLEVRVQQETVWLSLNQMAELFQRDKSVVSRHIKNIFDEGELSRASVVAESATTATDGKTYQVEYFNLDVIISVGYRVKSHRGTQFRIWATQRLRESIVKGFTMDDERLKQRGGGNYFEELLARIRDIRSSEKIFWRKVLEIYATSIDYDPTTEASQQFFATVQNKMHWAAHGQTAAEVIHAPISFCFDGTQPGEPRLRTPLQPAGPFRLALLAAPPSGWPCWLRASADPGASPSPKNLKSRARIGARPQG